MNSNSLETWQIERLLKRVQAELHFLDRLEGRMHQKHFPVDDPIYAATKNAREAVRQLSVQLSHLLGPH